MLAAAAAPPLADAAGTGTTHRVSWGNSNVGQASINISVGDIVVWVLDQQGGHNVMSGYCWLGPESGIWNLESGIWNLDDRVPRGGT